MNKHVLPRISGNPGPGRPRKALRLEPEPPKETDPHSARITMSIEEMGRELGISRTTAYDLAQQPGFPSFTIGRRVLISRDGLMKWIESQCLTKAHESLQPVEK